MATSGPRPAALRRWFRVLAVAAACVLAGCASASSGSAVRPKVTAPTSTSVAATTVPESLPTTTVAPTFAGTIGAVTASDVPSTYRAGCPVGPDQLRMLRMSYWGFDGMAHLGAMVVNADVAQDVLTVFATLFAERFPIRQMVPEDQFAGSDPSSMAADNTSGFNCRNAVAPGPPQWSAHAYGEAIDVNPVENPYLEGGAVQPDAGAPFIDRADVRPGMATSDGQLVRAFESVGWQWGGRWTDSPDYQHFSKTGG